MTHVLVTGVGGGVGQSVLKALQDTPYDAVGVDSDALAVGLHAVHSGYLGWEATHEAYIDRLLSICRLEECRLIFAGHDIELIPLSHHRTLFEAETIIPVVSSPEVIGICDDKLATSAFLKEHGFPCASTYSLRDVDTPSFPVVLKPQRGGARSRRTYLARDEREFEVYRRLVDPDNCVVQEYIEGDEFTCGTVTFAGRLYGSITMRRYLRSGDTYKAFVEKRPEIDSLLQEVVRDLQPFGPCNFQLRLSNQTPVIFEINARCSGTTAARALAGFNEPLMVADYLLKGIEPRYEIREVTFLRYWQELMVENARISRLRESRHLKGTQPRL
jgi:carbamoyl-phosphate synthase large subunit